MTSIGVTAGWVQRVWPVASAMLRTVALITVAALLILAVLPAALGAAGPPAGIIG